MSTEVKDNGKPKYKTFNKLCRTLNELQTEWEASIKGGFPKDYQSAIPTNGQTEFKFGANVGPNHPNAKSFNQQP